MEQNEEIYIEDGMLIERDTELDIRKYLFVSDLSKGLVWTQCADSYYDYCITIDDFIRFAEFLKKERKDGTK